MEFDHRDPETKLFALTSSRAMLKPREELLAEIAKCDIVCANCHRARTYAAFMAGTIRLGGSRGEPSEARRNSNAVREKWTRTRSEQGALLRAFRQGTCFDAAAHSSGS